MNSTELISYIYSNNRTLDPYFREYHDPECVYYFNKDLISFSGNQFLIVPYTAFASRSYNPKIVSSAFHLFKLCWDYKNHGVFTQCKYKDVEYYVFNKGVFSALRRPLVLFGRDNTGNYLYIDKGVLENHPISSYIKNTLIPAFINVVSDSRIIIEDSKYNNIKPNTSSMAIKNIAMTRLCDYIEDSVDVLLV